MGIDGFSMSNLGMQRNLTSSQLANEADSLARQALENQIADVDGVGKREKAGAKDKDAAFNGMVPFIPSEEENEDEQQEDDNAVVQEVITESSQSDDEDDEEYEKYSFKYNDKGMIEIWDSETNKILRTISPEEACNVVGKFEKVPGFLVNKSI